MNIQTDSSTSRLGAKVGAALVASALVLCGSAHAFFDGQTGDVRPVDTSSPPGNMPMVGVFEHESGARCACTRSRTDRTLRCGPTAPARNANWAG